MKKSIKNITSCNCCKSKKLSKNGKSLDTLAQLGIFSQNTPKKDKINESIEDFPELDKGTSIDDKKTLSKRAKRKYISSSLSLGLVMINEAKREIELEEIERPIKRKSTNYSVPVHIAYPIEKAKTKEYFEIENRHRDVQRSYWNMYHCNREIIKDHKTGKVRANYCKNRLCLVCNSIRTAELLNKYTPVMEAWKDDMYMVTLTIENVTEDKLKQSIEEMHKVFTKVKDTLKKRYQYGKSPKSKYYELWADYPKFEGFRKFECTSNRENDYHPHFHILVKGKRCAEDLRTQWVKIIEKSNIISCQLKGKDKNDRIVYLQDVRKATEGAGKELFKYFTKILSNKEKKEDSRNIYINRLDTIFKAMRGKRVFQNFGFKISDYVDIKEQEQKEENILDSDVFEMTLKDSEEEIINNIWLEYYSSIKEPETKLSNLINDLAQIQIDRAELFLNFYDKLQTREQIESSILKFESSTRTPNDLDILQNELKNIDEEIYINLMERDENEQQSDELPLEVFIYNERIGNWYSTIDGNELFEYKISESIKEVTKRFKYPKKYTNTIIDLYLKKQKT